MMTEAVKGRIRSVKSNAAGLFSVARHNFSERHATATSADNKQ
jgi:hypothetical protein